MSIIVVPGQFHAAPHPAGKLASTLLSVTVAGMADPARFRRGKSYVADHSVSRLEVSPGQLVASVAGTREQPYQVIIAVRVVPPVEVGSPEALRTQLNRLTPDAADLMLSCTCPDMDEPCKHEVAALLAFAGELVTRPELLLQWRCAPSGEVPERPQVGSRARTSERHLRLAPALPTNNSPDPTSPWEAPEWIEFLGASPPDLPDVPREPARLGRAVLGSIDLSAVVRSALDALTADQ
jgi:uncharacterized Zn finger protein